MGAMNPFFEGVRSTLYRQTNDLCRSVEDQDLSDEPFDEDEALREIEDTKTEIQRGMWNRAEYCETPVDVYRSLIWLGVEWNHQDMQHVMADNESLDSITSVLYSRSSGRALDEAEKIAWFLERDL